MAAAKNFIYRGWNLWRGTHKGFQGPLINFDYILERE